mmetsp:Transcript_20257/g.48623  ORF Transcript_20257/g.48623 Transcript_20257/m.48623 type:complete len:201 (-) Transcript_20257:3980-4582(-)
MRCCPPCTLSRARPVCSAAITCSTDVPSMIVGCWLSRVAGSFTPSGKSVCLISVANCVAKIHRDAPGSSFDHSNTKSSKQLSGMGNSSSEVEKWPRRTATSAWMRTQNPTSVKLMKYGIAMNEPQSDSVTLPRPDEEQRGSLGAEPSTPERSTWPSSWMERSCIMPFQFSPVAQRKSRSSARPKVSKLASLLMNSPWRTL